MSKEIITIGIIGVIAICANMAMAAPSNSVQSYAISEIKINITPDTLNLLGNGKYITAFIPIDEISLDTGTLTLTDGDNSIGVEYICDFDLEYFAVKFDRKTVLDWYGVEDVDTSIAFEIVDLYVNYDGDDDGVVDKVFTDTTNTTVMLPMNSKKVLP